MTKIKLTLTTNGNKLYFSKKEPATIKKQNPITKIFEAPIVEIISTHPVYVCFDIIPSSINKDLFMKERENPYQEKTRRIILEAFEELKNNPEKYDKPFQTLWIKKTWNSFVTVEELQDLVRNTGYDTADWVHQSLEYAQRITNCYALPYIHIERDANDRAWQVINNYPPNEPYRLVRWKNGNLVFVFCGWDDYSKSFVGSNNDGFVHNGIKYPDTRLQDAVPSIVRYKQSI